MSGTPTHRHLRLLALASVTIVVLGWSAFLLLSPPVANDLLVYDRSTAVPSPETVARIEAFCGDCHAVPRPESFPRDRWHFEVRKGYEFYARSGRQDLDPPPISATLSWYLARAPEQLSFPSAVEAVGDPRVRFRTEHIALDTGLGVLPEIAHLHWGRLAADERALLLACDMRYGHIFAVDLHRGESGPPRVLARLRNPARIELCDLDGDGRTDPIVADLGSYLPADHDRGRVVLLRRQPDADAYEPLELATGMGRVSDVRSVDIDVDGRLDLVVAEFGWHDTGGIWLLKNNSTPGGRLEFTPDEIDDRPGAIHVPVHDVNSDGRPDIVALVSQEYESVDILLNLGQARFARHNVWAAPDLTFGSTGIELVDLNGDGRLDILSTNGDAFDNSWVSPWHGVQWLENLGNGHFEHHRLTELPGAYRALAADFDRDGDQDVVVTALLPPDAQPSALRNGPRASIVYLEQADPGDFQRHTLEWDRPWYATLAIGDFDSDGDPDFAVASGPMVAEGRDSDSALAVWWNETPTHLH